MCTMTTTAERLFEAAQGLPEPLLAEVLDFAEFLRARQTSMNSQAGDISLASLCGGLENTQSFMGSPLAIQQRLRDEWH
jgi:hypothetical protein